ncbi:MAG: PilZ domain-containing protein, partial [Myxococcota bacterium]|nr:PilZ domain-containing protein [Myxococcota bacterium]
MTDDTKEFDRDLTDFGLDADDSFDAAPFGDFEDSDSLGWDPEAEGFVLSDVGLGQWQASMIEDEVMLSPERIRFATLASIQCDGQGAKVDGVITNLSSEGLACVCAAELDPGSKVEISFQIDLSDEVLVIPAEIIWRRYADMGASEGDPSYGVRFLELTEQQGNVIDDLIRERTEGRASEWSMPALPILESAAPMTPRSRRGWVMAGTAATAGLAMALAVLLLPGAESVADADR